MKDEVATTLLEVKNLKKSFYNNVVLNDISFSIKRGTVLGLMGQNGAGKSTLVKILTGVYEKDGGSILIENKEVSFSTIKEANDKGIALVFQELSLALNMSVADNIFIHNWPKNNLGLVKKDELYDRTKQLLDSFNINIDPADKVSDLSSGERQIVEILKAVSKKPQILILDEPTSSLEKKEIDVLFQFIRQLKREGYSIIYISHHMSEIFKIVDNLVVLRDGKKVLDCKKEESNIQQLVNIMVGSEQKLDINYSKNEDNISNEIVLEVTELSRYPYFKDINFTLRRGEILGIAGIVGSGKQELCETLFGIRQADSGNIKINGKAVKIKDPHVAKKNGILGLPENRKTQGLFLDHSIKDNMITCILDEMKNGLLLSNKKIDETVSRYKAATKIKMGDNNEIIRYLSGGNQQKVLVSKCIAANPQVLVAMDPTRGIDVAAKADIHNILRELSAQGLSVIVISSELDELLTMSDRILVINSGTLTEEFKPNEFDENKIMISMHNSISEVR
ncbi:MAG TPA: sugar ABC transporter ATP-binding protein [Clostridiales bacterium]|nr:sugar ABC transporter ATP-binding protein [Clostridiales bacterium]